YGALAPLGGEDGENLVRLLVVDLPQHQTLRGNVHLRPSPLLVAALYHGHKSFRLVRRRAAENRHSRFWPWCNINSRRFARKMPGYDGILPHTVRQLLILYHWGMSDASGP